MGNIRVPVELSNYGYHKVPVFIISSWLEDVQTTGNDVWLWIIRGEEYIS